MYLKIMPSTKSQMQVYVTKWFSPELKRLITQRDKLKKLATDHQEKELWKAYQSFT